MQNGTCNIIYLIDVEQRQKQSFYPWKCSGFSTGKHRRFSIFTAIHLYIKIFHTKNGKGHILTLMSNMLYFNNCLSYEMVQHKQNQGLTNIIEPSYVAHCKIKLILKNIYNSGIKD